MTDDTLSTRSLSVHRKQRSNLTLLVIFLVLAMLCLVAFHDCWAFPIANEPSVFEPSSSGAFDGTNYLVMSHEKIGTAHPVSAR